MTSIDADEQNRIKAFYDEVYHKGAPGNCMPTGHHLRLARRLRVNGSSKVLDVACGTGGFLAACRENGADIAGVDLSDTAIAACRASLPGGEFHACAAERLPFAEDQFDLVSCLGSLEHFSDPLEALKEMVRVAKPGASYVLLVPNKDFLTRKLGFYGGTYQVDAKEVVRTLEEWNTLFKAAGLTVTKRWRDLHVVSWNWVSANGWQQVPVRAAQALALPFWPLSWQYQVFHLARAR